MLQTPFVQDKLKQWVEKQTEGALSIGKVEGIIPLWLHLSDISYKTEEIDARFNNVRVVISPFSLLLGHLSILRLHIDEAKILSTGKEWPSVPFPIDIHSMEIEKLSYNEMEGIAMTGAGELSEDFSFHLTITQEDLPQTVIKLTLEGVEKTKTVSVIANIKSPIGRLESPLINLWLSGIFNWKKETFTGSLHGFGFGRKIMADVLFINDKLSLQSVSLDLPIALDTRIEWTKKEGISIHIQGDQLTWKDLSIREIVLSGKVEGKSLLFQVQMQDLVVLDPAYEVFPSVHLELQGKATANQLMFSGNIYGLGSSPFTLSGEVPIDITQEFGVNENAPFALRVKGMGSIDPLLGFLENASIIARGNVNLDLTVVGTWKQPSIEGYLIYEGRVESLTTGALFRDIHMEMEGVGRAFQIRSLIAHDFDRGDLTGTGQIEWDPDNHFPFSFNLYTSRYTILSIDPFTASVNSQVNLSGNLHEMTISGNATIVKGHLSIPNKMPVDVPTVEVTYIHPLPTPKPEVEEEKKEIPIYWDIAVEAPGNLTIEGRGLTSEWRGMMHISGEQNNLSYHGKLKFIQGRFTVLNRNFDLTEGKIRIEGLDPKDIYVDLKGDYELPNLTASIVLTGTLDRTRFSFCSNPQMSTNQILSWILFDQDINELTPMQACRLASLLVSLSGEYSGPKTFDNIKEGLGIDVFSITDCDIDSADLTFQVGKYLSQGTFVGVNKSISGDFDSVIIQTRLFRDFFLEANYGGSLNGVTPNGGKIVFKWYKTY